VCGIWLAEYLGQADPAFTLRLYAHLLPWSHDRAVISERFTRLMGPDGLRRPARHGP
jgi:hypothetical protein